MLFFHLLWKQGSTKTKLSVDTLTMHFGVCQLSRDESILSLLQNVNNMPRFKLNLLSQAQNGWLQHWESLACLPVNFNIQQKDRLFWKTIFLIYLKKPSLLFNGEVIRHGNDSTLPKELHGYGIYLGKSWTNWHIRQN